jgi:type IV secretory pathway protease TraF
MANFSSLATITEYSTDSREFGWLSADEIVGKMLFKFGKYF